MSRQAGSFRRVSQVWLSPGILPLHDSFPVQDLPICRQKAVASRQGRRGDQAVGRITVETFERGGGNPDLTVHGDFAKPGSQKVLTPYMDRYVELEAFLLNQHRGLPKGDRRHGKLACSMGLVDRFPGLGAQPRVCAVEPEKDMGVEENQRSASQVSSIGATTSPLIFREPRWRPKREVAWSG